MGNLLEHTEADTNTAPWREPPGLSVKDTDVTADVIKQTCSVTGGSLNPAETDPNAGVTWAGLTPSRPHVDPQSGEWILNAWDVECIAVGAGILGAGGGGNPNVGRVRAREAVSPWLSWSTGRSPTHCVIVCVHCEAGFFLRVCIPPFPVFSAFFRQKNKVPWFKLVIFLFNPPPPPSPSSFSSSSQP